MVLVGYNKSNLLMIILKNQDNDGEWSIKTYAGKTYLSKTAQSTLQKKAFHCIEILAAFLHI